MKKNKAISTSPYCHAFINRFVAASFIPDWGYDDFLHGRYKGKWRMVAKHDKAFALLRTEGFIHELRRVFRSM